MGGGLVKKTVKTVHIYLSRTVKREFIHIHVSRTVKRECIHIHVSKTVKRECDHIQVWIIYMCRGQ